MKLKTAKTVASSLVGSRLDYANAVLYGTSVKNIRRLQRLQNAVARIVLKSDRRCQPSPLLKQLYWLPIKFRIDFKVATLIFKIRTTSMPNYLSLLIADYAPRRVLRSTDARRLLQTPRVKIVIGSLAFRSAGPAVWNGQPI